MLLERGSDVNARTWDNWTALHEAVLGGHVAVVEKLLEWGADMTVSNSDEETAWDFTNGDPNMRRVLNHYHHEQQQPGTSGTTLPARMVL